jgi:hypothetical protein
MAPIHLPVAGLKMSFFGFRWRGRGPVLDSGLLLPPEAEAVVQEGEEDGVSLLSSLLAVSELPEPELTPLRDKNGN